MNLVLDRVVWGKKDQNGIDCMVRKFGYEFFKSDLHSVSLIRLYDFSDNLNNFKFLGRQGKEFTIILGSNGSYVLQEIGNSSGLIYLGSREIFLVQAQYKVVKQNSQGVISVENLFFLNYGFLPLRIQRNKPCEVIDSLKNQRFLVGSDNISGQILQFESERASSLKNYHKLTHKVRLVIVMDASESMNQILEQIPDLVDQLQNNEDNFINLKDENDNSLQLDLGFVFYTDFPPKEREIDRKYILEQIWKKVVNVIPFQQKHDREDISEQVRAATKQLSQVNFGNSKALQAGIHEAFTSLLRPIRSDQVVLDFLIIIGDSPAHGYHPEQGKEHRQCYGIGDFENLKDQIQGRSVAILELNVGDKTRNFVSQNQELQRVFGQTARTIYYRASSDATNYIQNFKKLLLTALSQDKTQIQSNQ